MNNYLYLLSQLQRKTIFWIGVLVFAVSLELAALFYQYVLDYLPCVLCIHVRVWLLGMIVVSLLALKLRVAWSGMLIVQSLILIISIGLWERSYQLLGTERGFVFGDCNMESGLPAWLALDQWIPSVFKVWEACGYTPVLFGVTMAEALIVLSTVLVLLSGMLLLSLVIEKLRTH